MLTAQETAKRLLLTSKFFLHPSIESILFSGAVFGAETNFAPVCHGHIGLSSKLTSTVAYLILCYRLTYILVYTVNLGPLLSVPYL